MDGETSYTLAWHPEKVAGGDGSSMLDSGKVNKSQ